MSKKILITQSNYIPWKGYFDAINMADVLVLYDEMQFTRRDWRNRNKIKTANGTQWLSVPVNIKGKFNQKINETRVANNQWRRKHWEAIARAYGKSSCFDQYKVVFEGLYTDSVEEGLSEINRSFIEAVCEILAIQTPIRWSREFDFRGGKTEKLLNICKDLNGTHYITGPAAGNYMDVSLFTEAGIEIEWLDYSGYPEYPQMHGAFEHAVSVLDLIFNTGPKATRFLKSF